MIDNSVLQWSKNKKFLDIKYLHGKKWHQKNCQATGSGSGEWEMLYSTFLLLDRWYMIWYVWYMIVQDFADWFQKTLE